jgi:hypothetical protein
MSAPPSTSCYTSSPLGFHGGGAIMPKFKVGDHVARIGSLVPQYMRDGVITRVIPNEKLPERFTEYEVNFGNMSMRFYETQLRLVKSPTDSN